VREHPPAMLDLTVRQLHPRSRRACRSQAIARSRRAV